MKAAWYCSFGVHQYGFHSRVEAFRVLLVTLPKDGKNFRNGKSWEDISADTWLYYSVRK